MATLTHAMPVTATAPDSKLVYPSEAVAQHIKLTGAKPVGATDDAAVVVNLAYDPLATFLANCDCTDYLGVFQREVRSVFLPVC